MNVKQLIEILEGLRPTATVMIEIGDESDNLFYVEDQGHVVVISGASSPDYDIDE